MVDKTLILRKLADLEAYLKQIGEYTGISVEAYANDWKVQRIVERTLQIMIETCLDIAGHIISDAGYRAPDSYADMFKILQENGILEKPLMSAMDKMAKFRNIVVHQYEKIDPAIVTTILNKHLDDFSRFSSSIINYLKQ